MQLPGEGGGHARRLWRWAGWLAVVVLATGCTVLNPEYEYEEELDLALDGSATLDVHASVPALVALRGARLDLDPQARVDEDAVRALFSAPAVEVVSVDTSRRDGRQFVHVSIDAPNLPALSTVAPLAWSVYSFDRRADELVYHQTVGPARGAPVGDVGWTGDELVAFRIHVPSRIPFHNSPGTVQRGNILVWEQPLADRLRGVPLDLQVRMEPTSILADTLLLFLFTAIAAGLAFALAIWWMARQGRDTARPAEPDLAPGEQRQTRGEVAAGGSRAREARH